MAEPLPAGIAEPESSVRPAPGAGAFVPSPAGWVARMAVVAAALAVVVVVPLARPPFDVILFTRAVSYAVVGLSLNVLIGYTGQISLGHQAFVGIGAFTSGYVVTEAEQPFLIAVLAAMAVGGLQAGVLGAASLRIRGLYFALVTLAYGLLAEESLFKITALTGGAAGQKAAKPSGFTTEHRFYFLSLLFLAGVLWVDYRMMKSKGGRALLALRENPRVASTYGVNVKLYTLIAFVVAGVFAGLGGAIFAHNDTNVTSVVFNFRLALIFIIMTVVGGLRSRSGVVIGSAFFALIAYILEKLHVDKALNAIPLLPEFKQGVAELVIGPLLLLLTLTLYPGGIGQQIRPLLKWIAGNRFDIHDRGLKEAQITDVRA